MHQRRRRALFDRVDGFANRVVKAENSFDHQRIPLDVIVEIEGVKLLVFAHNFLIGGLYASAVHPPYEKLGGLNHIAPQLAENLGNIRNGW